MPLIVQSIYDHLTSDCEESLRDIAIRTLQKMTRLNPQCVVSSVLRDIPWCDTCGARPPHDGSRPLGPAQAKGWWLGQSLTQRASSLQVFCNHVADDGLRTQPCRGRAGDPAAEMAKAQARWPWPQLHRLPGSEFLDDTSLTPGRAAFPTPPLSSTPFPFLAVSSLLPPAAPPQPFVLSFLAPRTPACHPMGLGSTAGAAVP